MGLLTQMSLSLPIQEKVSAQVHVTGSKFFLDVGSQCLEIDSSLQAGIRL